jgi:hypothetical protein
MDNGINQLLYIGMKQRTYCNIKNLLIPIHTEYTKIYSKGIKSDTNSEINWKFKYGIERKAIETNHNSATHQFFQETPNFRNATMVERRRSEYFEKWLKMTLDRTP